MLIEMTGIYKTYLSNTDNPVYALRGIDLFVKKGEIIAISGKSGSGKSTLLHILGCLDNADCGKYFFDNCDINNLPERKKANLRNKEIGYVMQDFALIPDFSVMDNVMIPSYFNKENMKKMTEKAERILTDFELSGYFNSPVNRLSGGQKQRVAIARALLLEPKLLLADEPTGALDEETGKSIMNLFKEINKEGTTVIVVTHDANVASYCQRTIRLHDGEIVGEEQNQ